MVDQEDSDFNFALAEADSAKQKSVEQSAASKKSDIATRLLSAVNAFCTEKGIERFDINGSGDGIRIEIKRKRFRPIRETYLLVVVEDEDTFHLYDPPDTIVSDEGLQYRGVKNKREMMRETFEFLTSARDRDP